MTCVRPLIACGALALVVGCASGHAARVDDLTVAEADVDRIVDATANNAGYMRWLARKHPDATFIDASGRPTSTLIASVLTGEISHLVTADEATERGIEPSAADREAGRIAVSGDVGGRRELAAFPDDVRDMLVRRAAVVAAFERSLIGDLSPKEYYDDHRDDFIRPCSRDLVVASVDAAKAAQRRIEAGASFADVASDVSLDEGSGPKGGDLGCNTRGDLVPELERASFEQPVGEVSEPIETDEGVHLLLVYERELQPYDRVRGEVAGAVVRYGKERLSELVAQRLRGADVEVAAKYGRWDERRMQVIAG